MQAHKKDFPVPTIFNSLTGALDLLMAADAPVVLAFPPRSPRRNAASMQMDTDDNGVPQGIYFQSEGSARRAAELLGIPVEVTRRQHEVESGVYEDNRTMSVTYRLAVPQDAVLWQVARVKARAYYDAHAMHKGPPPALLDTLLATPNAELARSRTVLLVGGGTANKMLVRKLEDEGFSVQTIPESAGLEGAIRDLAMNNRQVVHILWAQDAAHDMDAFTKRTRAGEIPHLTRFIGMEAVAAEVDMKFSAPEALSLRLRCSMIDAALRDRSEPVPVDLAAKVAGQLPAQGVSFT